jgi:hypothetical protein
LIQRNYLNYNQNNQYIMRYIPLLSLAIFLVLLSPAVLAQSTPAIFYTDIISGPNTGGENNNGCYLTIFGKGFGNSRGTSTVTVGGGAVASYKYWSDSKVSVQLGPAASSGNVVLTTSAGSTAASEQFTVRAGDIYFVSSTGNDGTGVVNDITKSYRCPNTVLGLAAFGAGDFVVTRGGTYDLDDGNNCLSSAGNGWINIPNKGSFGSPITIYGYPGETIMAQIDGAQMLFRHGSSSPFEHFVIANFNASITSCNTGGIMAIGSTASGGICTSNVRGTSQNAKARFWRIANIDVTGNGIGGMCTGTSGASPIEVGWSENGKIFGYSIHDFGTPANQECHGHILYIATTQSDNEFGWIHLYNVPYTRAAIQVHQDGFGGACTNKAYLTDLIIHDVKIHNIQGQPILFDGGTGNITLYNALVYDVQARAGTENYCNYGTIFAPRGGWGYGNYKIYNNTFYVNPDYTGAGSLIEWQGNIVAAEIKNNIFVVTDPQDNYYGYDGTPNITISSVDYNIWYGSSSGLPPFAGSHDSILDPKLTDPVNDDFTPQSNSPACGAGDPSIGPDIGAIACEIQCTENWTCTPWSSCSGGQQSRACTDQNNCGTTQSKPAETQSCVSGPPPTLLFSDLISAPKSGLGDGLGQGAIVTIWGKNLGATQGASKVYVKDSAGVSREAVYVYNWRNATQHAGHPADLYTYHKMQYIQFSVPSASADGPGSIYAVVNGVASNELPLTIRSTGTIRYVGNGCGAGQGSPANSGPGTYASPWQTFQYAVGGTSAMAAGDTLYVCNGYVADDEWDGIGVNNYVGSNSTSRTSFLAYPNSAVTIQCNSGRHTALANWGSGDHITVSRMKLIANAQAVDTGAGALGYWRIIANEVTDYVCAEDSAAAFGSSAGTNDLIIYGNYIHDWGCSATSNQQHTTYFSLRNGASQPEAYDLGWNYLINNQARDSFHIYDEHQCQGWTGIFKIHDNVVVNQVGAGNDMGGSCDTGRSMPLELLFYNNLFINTGKNQDDGDFGVPTIAIWGSSDPAVPSIHGSGRFYNNTFYGFFGGAAWYDKGVVCAHHLVKPATQFYWHWKNNVIVDTQDVVFYCEGYPDWVNPTTTGHNLWYSIPNPSKSPPSWDTNTLNVDPLFMDPVNGDFTPQANSPVCGAGDPSIGPDIGAIPCASSSSACIHESDNNPCNGCISQPELTAYIDRWKFNNQDVTIRELISAIGEWKRNSC